MAVPHSAPAVSDWEIPWFEDRSMFTLCGPEPHRFYDVTAELIVERPNFDGDCAIVVRDPCSLDVYWRVCLRRRQVERFQRWLLTGYLRSGEVPRGFEAAAHLDTVWLTARSSSLWVVLRTEGRRWLFDTLDAVYGTKTRPY